VLRAAEQVRSTASFSQSPKLTVLKISRNWTEVRFDDGVVVKDLSLIALILADTDWMDGLVA